MKHSPITLLLFLTQIIYVPSFIPLANADRYYAAYEDCGPFICGNSTIRYPFGYCGPFYSFCENDQSYVEVGSSLLRVLGDITASTYSTRTLKVVQDDIGDTYQSGLFDGITYRSRRFFNLSLSPGYTEGTIVNCTRQEQLQSDPQLNASVTTLDCAEHNSYCFFYPETGLQKCTSYAIIFPENASYNMSADKIIDQLQKTGFEITWSINYNCNSCEATRGRCYSDSYDGYCICAHDGVHKFNCSDGILLQAVKPRSLTPKTVAEIFFIQCALFSIVVVSCIVVRRKFCHQRTGNEQEQSILAFMDPLDPRTRPSVENFLHYYSSQMPTRYSYSQIMAYTNNFADKLGKGGFGTVYKGKLPNGRLIAVKILDESKQNEQQFIAEVATVGRTYHINLVSLLGYCSQASKRALVYEYMVNGSLDNYIHGHGCHQNELDWKQLHSIAVGTARGIAYLHGECRNRILHFDIKPHNVLLDANFLPKVADFGLASISDREKSHISVTNRGTLGYAAPEMCSQNPGPVSDRSDVYSYGMLVMEMVGGRKNIDFNESSKFFYTEWAFKQVEKGEYGNLRKGTISQEDQRIAKKLSLVGLWCIQYIATSRPSMSKVIQMLEGDVDISTPPFPFQHVDISVQPSTSDPSSSTYAPSASVQSSSSNALQVQMTNPTTTQTAESSRQVIESIA